MSYFVLADCNTFYVSCERLFNPKIRTTPVIVLSNNDGCVVALSGEAKAIGIKMGQPYFQIQEACIRHKVAVYSSNYRLYGDLSQRVMNVLGESYAEIEVYSIDEAFLKYPDSLSSELVVADCIELRKKVKKWVGIPMSLGVAPTKVLAKIATDIAKRQKVEVFDITSKDVQTQILKDYPIERIWGIGENLTRRLRSMQIYTAADLMEKDPYIIRQKLGVMGERILLELQGVSCLDLEDPSDKKSICSSRSFGKPLTDQSQIAEALSAFASVACVKLRAQNSCANAIYVSLQSVIDPQTGKRRRYGLVKKLSSPTNDTSEILTMAKKALKVLFREEEHYNKCGIVLLDLIAEHNVVPDFFIKNDLPQRKKLMSTIDTLNHRFGKDKLFFGAVGTDPQWRMRCNKRSPYTTTDWKGLPIVKA